MKSIIVVLAVGLAVGCVRPQQVRHVAGATAPATCRGLVDASGRASEAEIRWRAPVEASSRAALSIACSTVGPGVYEPPPAANGENVVPIDHLVVASWNVHVGGGDLAAFVADLRAGRLTNGEPVREFVIMLQEAFRSGGVVPQTVPSGVSVPDRIAETPPEGVRQDIVATARTLGLGVFYLPSMRNGAEIGERAEDRGNAILSTRPLSAFEGIELPYARQRRVAVSAVVDGRDSTGHRWDLRVVSSHLNASSGPRYLWMFSSAVREHQAHHLVDVLAEDTTGMVMGSDLNTWAGGTREPAYDALRRAFPQTAEPTGSTFGLGLRLDYVFFRIPAAWHGQSQAVGDDFGSDHRPLVGSVRFGPA